MYAKPQSFTRREKSMSNKQRISNEQEILKLVSEGDSKAFRTLYMHYYDRLFNFAMLFLHSEAACEDVIGDVFFVLWKDRSMLTAIPNFHPYIYQAVRNGCLNVLKSGYISKRDDLPETKKSCTDRAHSFFPGGGHNLRVGLVQSFRRRSIRKQDART